MFLPKAESDDINITELVVYVQKELVGRRLTGKYVHMSETNLRTTQTPNIIT